MLSQLKRDLKKLKNPRRAKFVAGYFKTGKGEYGEGDVFWGITVPEQRTLAKRYKDLLLRDIQQLLSSKVHEWRLTALLILVEQYRRANSATQEKIVKLYLKNLPRINNWDLVDTSAPYILGDYLTDKDKAQLYTLAHSPNLWRRRVAILSTQAFIRQGHFDDTLKIVEILLEDTHDLIHKAVGWMLREVGNRDRQAEVQFLNKHYRQMPRTMLRYAIEKFDTPTRQKYLKRT